MKRILLTLTYDGTNYKGWQRQLAEPSVQEKLEKALQKATGAVTPVLGASRTDAGVHALGQAAHFDTASTIPQEKYPLVLNTLLPDNIRVLSAREVPIFFHARFFTKGKRYLYLIHNADIASALNRHTHAHVSYTLNVPKMQEAAGLLVGEHDFAAFCAAGSTHKTTVREIYDISLTKEGETLTLSIYGNAFLYNMVRIIAGTLIDIGRGKLDKACILEAFQTGDRLALGYTAPAHGLCLEKVYYNLAE